MCSSTDAVHGVDRFKAGASHQVVQAVLAGVVDQCTAVVAGGGAAGAEKNQPGDHAATYFRTPATVLWPVVLSLPWRVR